MSRIGFMVEEDRKLKTKGAETLRYIEIWFSPMATTKSGAAKTEQSGGASDFRVP
ncbi:hypothetical protein GCM10023333_14580 [Ferrimonas pelagia]|uniref:Uncharacterized protein n=1 Tax=Ferrimonas pelagia TaxID=1177826 RepID=A0ABP9EKU5_9GAMM